MALTFKVETPPGYLLMTYEGTYESSLAGEFTDQILAVSKTYQPQKLLIDLRQVKGGMSALSRYNVSMMAAAKYFGAIITRKIPKCRYAIVGSPPLVDSKKYEETVAVSQGVPVKVCTEMNEALAWLEVELPGK